MQQVWVIDDDQSIRLVLSRALKKERRNVSRFGSADEALQALESSRPDVIITDLKMPGRDGLDLLKTVHQASPSIPVIVITAFSDLDTTVDAFSRGAFEYLPKPFDLDSVCDAVDRALELESSPVEDSRPATGGIIGESPVMQQLFRQIGKLASTRLNVLVTGETGTGKELVARALHQHSPLREGPMVAINTAAIPSELLESELFGHEQGAFTGAHRSSAGRFRQANGGTLFLDEIGDMPAELQSRLLRVLAEGEYYPVGGRELVHVDVRVIAATHQDLARRVRSGHFRDDLFHRLNVVRIEVPALRERGKDVILLARHFLNQESLDVGLDPKRLSDEAAQLLLQHDWPGNVRELENLCRRLTVMTVGTTVKAREIQAVLDAKSAAPDGDEDWSSPLRRWADHTLARRPGLVYKESSQILRRELIHAALDRTGGSKVEAAQLLGCGRNTLTRWLKELGIDL